MALVYLLGPVAIEGIETVIEERDFAERRAILAFAYFMLERDRLLSMEELAKVLWSEGRPPDWESEIEGLVAGLHGLLDKSGVKGREIIGSGGGGYTVQLGDVWLDAKAAVDRISEAEEAVDRGDVSKAQRVVSAAMKIVGRPFLPGQDGPWIDMQRERFHELEQACSEILERAERGAAPSKPIRVMKTFMFTDIVDSTKFVELLGDEHWTDLVRWHDLALRECFAAHNGEEVDHAGDGFFVAFGDQQSAVACAVTIQRRLADQRKSHGFAPQVRIGLHSAEATSDEGGYKGRGVHEAARIGSLATGGQIMTSRATIEGLEEIEVQESRRMHLKGFSEPVEILTLDWGQEA